MRFRFIRISSPVKYMYRILNNADNIVLRDMEINEKYVTFSVDYSQYRELKEMFLKKAIPIKEEKTEGIYSKIINLSVIKGILCVICVFILLLFINSFFIWKISVDGNYSYTQYQIISYIHKQNIREGNIKNNINCEKLEQKIRQKFEGISWVCAEIKGTNLMIHVKENYITDISKKEDKPYNLVAEEDGKIVSVIARKGKLNIKRGDKTKKGDVLISGVVDVVDESGEKIFDEYCNADGDIVAEVNYTYKDSQKIVHSEKTDVHKKSFSLLSMFGFKWLQPNKKKDRDIICTETPLRFFGNYYLPLSLQKYTIEKYKKINVEYTKEQAQKILEARLMNKLVIMEQKGYKIIKKSVRIRKIRDSYVMEGKIKCHKPFGVVSYINIKEDKEEVQ